MPRTTKPNGNGTKITPAEDFPLISYPPFMTLTLYQRNFLMLYWLKPITRQNNADIYRKAFHNPTMNDATAYVESSTLLRHPKIVSCLRKIDEIRLDNMSLTADKIVREECCIAFSDVGLIMDEEGLCPLSPAELDPNTRKAISGCEVKERLRETTDPNTGQVIGVEVKRLYKYSLWNKGQALERLAKIRGINAPTRTELSGPNGEPIRTDVRVASIDLTHLSTDELAMLITLAEKVREHQPVEEEL